MKVLRIYYGLSYRNFGTIIIYNKGRVKVKNGRIRHEHKKQNVLAPLNALFTAGQMDLREKATLCSTK